MFSSLIHSVAIVLCSRMRLGFSRTQVEKILKDAPQDAKEVSHIVFDIDGIKHYLI